jgi:hypothetical protein
LNWTEVYRKLDHAELYIPDAAAFQVLVDVWRLAQASAGGLPFPYDVVLFEPHRHARGHLSLLRAAISAPAELVDFLTISPRVLRSISANDDALAMVRVFGTTIKIFECSTPSHVFQSLFTGPCQPLLELAGPH